MTELDVAFLRECLDYEPNTGTVLWKHRPRSHFSSEAAFQTHDRHKAGTVAGGVDSSTGYRVVGLCRKLFYAHRVAWALHHGEWPNGVIDHIDGDRLNNALSNLRVVTQFENARNASIGRNNTSGAVGVSFDKRSGKWRARVMHQYREVYSGLFASKEAAIAARAAKAKDYGFHENNGRVADFGARHGVWAAEEGQAI